MNIIVSGGAGFIGSALVRQIIANSTHHVLVIDKLSYASHPHALRAVEASERYQFLQCDINDAELIHKAFAEFKPDVLMHLAAETHVDNSIASPDAFMQTNMLGTFRLLEVCRDYHQQHSGFRFLQVSTDEVFGELTEGDRFDEGSCYQPSSPYSASKAAADHLARAWMRTYGLPVLVAHCSNNYGPFQHAEKLIPTVISKALAGEVIPIYGNGEQIRDWIFVEDCAEALMLLSMQGTPGESYAIGAENEHRNIDVVNNICRQLDAMQPRAEGSSYAALIRFVEDRPGHDRRYALNCQKMREQLHWAARVDFDAGIKQTLQWYRRL